MANVITFAVVTSSVTRGGGAGGGSSSPHWLVKYAKSHVFCAFEADFLRKMENSPPPIQKQPPFKRLNLRNWTKNFGEDLFFFWRSPNFGRKKPLYFGFRPKNHSQFW